MAIQKHLWEQITTEIEAIVGRDFAATDEADRIGYSVDYF